MGCMTEKKEEKPGRGRVAKKPYKKPEVRQVKLRPEEALLGFCKTTGSYGPATANCTSCYTTGS